MRCAKFKVPFFRVFKIESWKASDPSLQSSGLYRKKSNHIASSKAKVKGISLMLIQKSTQCDQQVVARGRNLQASQKDQTKQDSISLRGEKKWWTKKTWINFQSPVYLLKRKVASSWLIYLQILSCFQNFQTQMPHCKETVVEMWRGEESNLSTSHCKLGQVRRGGALGKRNNSQTLTYRNPLGRENTKYQKTTLNIRKIFQHWNNRSSQATKCNLKVRQARANDKSIEIWGWDGQC